GRGCGDRRWWTSTWRPSRSRCCPIGVLPGLYTISQLCSEGVLAAVAASADGEDSEGAGRVGSAPPGVCCSVWDRLAIGHGVSQPGNGVELTASRCGWESSAKSRALMEALAMEVKRAQSTGVPV